MEAEELRQDWSLDLTTADAHGRVWHFDNGRKKQLGVGVRNGSGSGNACPAPAPGSRERPRRARNFPPKGRHGVR